MTAKTAITDAPSNTWCRAPGTVEGIAMIENIMEHIARKVKKDPLEVRLSNIADNEMKKFLPDFVKSVGEFRLYEEIEENNFFLIQIDYHNRKKTIEQFNVENRWTKRGIGIVPLKYHLGYFGTTHSMVSIYRGDGSVSVTCGGIEMGQGLNTKVAQTVSHVLGIPLEMVNVKPSNTMTAPNAIVTGGSLGSEISSFVRRIIPILHSSLKQSV